MPDNNRNYSRIVRIPEQELVLAELRAELIEAINTIRNTRLDNNNPQPLEIIPRGEVGQSGHPRGQQRSQTLERDEDRSDLPLDDEEEDLTSGTSESRVEHQRTMEANAEILERARSAVASSQEAIQSTVILQESMDRLLEKLMEYETITSSAISEQTSEPTEALEKKGFSKKKIFAIALIAVGTVSLAAWFTYHKFTNAAKG